MATWTSSDFIQIICAATILVAVIGVICQRLVSGKNIGVRAIQFVAAASLAPCVVLLAMGGKIDGPTTAAIIGAFVGYLFSTISKFDERSTR